MPESIKAAKVLASLNHKGVIWRRVDKDYKYAVHKVTYGKVKSIMSRTLVSQSEAHFIAIRLGQNHPYFEFTKTVCS